MNNIIFVMHYINSAMFLLFASILLGRSYIGLKQNTQYSPKNFNYSLFFISTLYLQMFLGFHLFFAKNSSNTNDMLLNITQTSLRFWPVEHLSTMIFALLIAHFGVILVRKQQESAIKYRLTIIYVGLTLFMVVLSLSSNYWFRF